MKTKTSLMKNLFKKINLGIKTVLADEVAEGTTPEATTTSTDSTQTTTTPTQTTTTQQAPTLNFETLIAKARQEEKEKLYPEITKLKADLEEKIKRVNQLLISLGEKDESIKKLESQLAEVEKGSKKSESEVVKQLNLKIEELTNALALKDGEIASVKIESYKSQKISECGGKLIPELVMGQTQEEIDASIQVAKQRYEDILAQVSVQTTATPQASKPTQNQIPPANPSTNQFSSNTVNVNDIAGMSMLDKSSRAHYAEMRKQLGLK